MVHYCLDYHKSSKFLDKVEEITIEYSFNNSIDGLLDFLDERYTQQINVFFKDISLYRKFVAELIKNRRFNHKNLTIKLTKEIFSILTEEEKLFFEDYQIPFFLDVIACDWEMLNILTFEANVDEAYIGGGLGFDLQNVGLFAQKNNIKLRACPNIATSAYSETPFYLKFFIRPEEIEFYADYIDVFDFYYTNIKALDSLYKIYKSGSWNLELGNIIKGIDLKYNVNNNTLAPLATVTFNCQRKCLINNNRCGICEKAFNLANTLKEKDIFIEKKK